MHDDDEGAESLAPNLHLLRFVAQHDLRQIELVECGSYRIRLRLTRYYWQTIGALQN